jgi:hypothetical protein
MGVSKEKCKESERLVEELRDEVYHKEEALWLARKELREREEHVQNIETEFKELQKLLIQLEPHGANALPKLMPNHANVTLDMSSVTHKSESSVEIGGQRKPGFRYMPSPPRTPGQPPGSPPRTASNSLPPRSPPPPPPRQPDHSQSIATTTTKPTMEPVACPVMLDFASLPRVCRPAGPPPHLLVADPLSVQAAPKIYRCARASDNAVTASELGIPT